MNARLALPGSQGIIGVLVAAGRGRRMGGTKQLIAWHTDEGDKPLIAASFDAISPACSEIVVVLGHESSLVEAALSPRLFTSVLADPDAQMIHSIAVGLDVVKETKPGRAALLQPGDHPEVGLDTLRHLLRAHQDAPNLVLVPSCGPRGGHPTLIPAACFRRVLDFARADGPGGLRALWQSEPQLVRRVEVEDVGIRLDLDTPDDLAQNDR